ncbi:MAG TPA: oligosaccharide flippase family protein [Hansschlegelia sp.]
MARKARSGGLRVLGWVGWAGADAGGRILLLTLSTAVLSRMLSPHDFGVTALVLTVVAVMSVFVGAPFEEALAQRKALRRKHLEAALAASWATGLALLALSIPGGMALGAFYDEPEIGWLLPVAAIAMFFSGHSDIATALARRRRRFNDVAFANLAGHAIGISIALAIAFAGAGLWALISVRLAVMIARAFLLQWRLGVVILPRWSTPHLRDLSRFAGFSFLDRLADNLIYLAFNNMVGAVYGVTTLGYVNMAMRLIEPIRGAVTSTAHNVSFSFFAAAAHDHVRLKESAETIASQTAFLIAPIFVGLAAVAPVLLPVVAGPGWEPASHIAVCLAIGGAISLPARLFYTALSAKARPEFGLLASVLGFVATVIALIVDSSLGPISVGIARIVGDSAQAGLAIALPAALLGWSRIDRLWAFLPPWALAGAMGVVVWGAIIMLQPHGDVVALAIAVPLGVAVYGLLLRLFARDALAALLGSLREAESVRL